MRRARAIRMKLGGSLSLADPFPEKPNGMHWRTYYRFCRNGERREGLALAGLESLESRLKRYFKC